MKAGLAAFVYSNVETEIIKAALTLARPWDCNEVGEIKERIKAFHLQFGGQVCCYCYRDVQGEFSMVLDIEHILPKRHYKSLTFDIRNLSVACKRCNMKMKRDDLDFLRLPMPVDNLEDGSKYKFVHPNIDDRDQHLVRIVMQVNTKKLVKYVVVDESEKGQFGYNYFRLDEFEVDSFDAAQGANQVSINEMNAVSSIRALVKEIEEKPEDSNEGWSVALPTASRI